MIAAAPVARNHRVLIIDDNRAIQDDFRKILSDQDPVRAAEARLFGTPAAVSFQMDFAGQGQEGLHLVEQALAAGSPYSMAFVDVRMPPGWDGIETTRRIWEVDPDLQIVICTAYSDYSWDELGDVLGQPDRLLILKKPFDTIEVVQLAHALTDKWRLLQESKRTVATLEQAVAERTAELASSNGTLRLEIKQRGVIEAMLRETQEKLEERYRFLAEAMPQMVWTATPDGNVDYFNQRWYDYTGMSVEQTRDWGWEKVLHPEDLPNCVARWTESFTTGCDYQNEYRFKRAADGLYRWQLGRAFPMRDDQGVITQWVGTCTDIDDYKRTQEALRDAYADLERRVAERTAELDTARRSLQGVLDAATQIAIIATDADRLITVFNSGAERMLGYSAAEMVGKKTSPALHLETELIEHARTLKVRFGRTNPGFDRLVENARHGKSEEREWTYVRKDGSHLTVNLALTALRDAKGEPNGYLNVASDITERKRSEAELERVRAELVQGLADATTANDALKLQTELLRRLNEERAALANLSELLAACASPEEAYAIFGGAAIGLFPSLAGVLHMYGPAQDQLMPVAAWGEWPVAALPVGAKECWALRRGRFYIGTGTTTPACGHAGPAQGLATLCVPLMADGEVLGVLQLRGPDAAMLQSSLQPASTAGDGLALTLANLRLRETLKEQSIRDPLTELFNRRYLTETLAREFARARRAGAPMAVIMLDVDHFKRFNDRFGHSAGDVVLREFGAFLKRSIRSDDLACRYGGEEFCLILPQTGRDGAQQRAESIRAGAARLVLNSEGCALEPITLSLGVALFPEDGDSAESLMRAADGALYQAKREGRNRVVMSQAAAVADDTAALDAPAA